MARLEWFQGENVFPLKTKVSSEQNARLLDQCLLALTHTTTFGVNQTQHISTNLCKGDDLGLIYQN